MIRRKHITALIVCATALAGCNPKLYPPKVEVPEKYIFGEGFDRDTLGIPEDWWKMFGDTILDGLIERSFAANRNLAAAVSRIEEARSNLKAVRAEYLPSFGFGRHAGASYAKPTKIDQSYILEATLSWEISLFGAMRHAKDAAKSGIMYSEWAYRGVKLSLAAEVATTYFTLLQYRRDLNIARRSSQLRRESATLIDSMFRRGMITGLNREQAMSLVYTAEADIPLYDRAIKQTMLSLNVLLGETPDVEKFIGTDTLLLSGYRHINIPIGVPSDILHRRPDVMEAYYRMTQAAANVGAARSARFPSLSLTANGGTSSDDITALFSKKSWIWSAFLSFTEPIYNFGALKRREMIAREKYRQSVLAYEQAYLQALSDVEKALVSISTYREQTERYEELVQASRNIAMMTNALYSSGLSAYLDVIDAERTLYDSQMQFVNLTAQQYINYVNLCKALGGGWNDIGEK